MGQVAAFRPATSHRCKRKRIMHSTALLGWFGAALSMTLPWPQVWRSVVRGRTGGLSATACWQGVAMPIGWITYGLLTGESVQIVTNTVTGLTGLSILVMVLVKQGELRTPRKMLISAAGAAGVLSAAAGSAVVAVTTDLGEARVATFLGSVLAITAMLSAVPQPLSLLRDRTQDLAGLSPLRWRLAAAACSCWFAYGLTTGQVAVWLSASVGLSAALIVCWVLWAAGRTPAAAAAPAALTVPAAVIVPAAVTVPARGTARVLRPAYASAAAVRPAVAGARIVRPAASVARSARPVSGPASTPVTAATRVTAATPVAALVPAPGLLTAPALLPAPTGPAAASRRPRNTSRPVRGTARVPGQASWATTVLQGALVPA
jgi:uncharacterized protein with PQ loop repeat